MRAFSWFGGLALLFASLPLVQGWAQEATPSPASAPDPYATRPGTALAGRNGVKPPVLMQAVNPSYSEQARAEKISGDVTVQLTVDANGNPSDVRVLRGLGYGLDEKAVEAVQQYKFRPATRDGVAVPVKLYIKVNFKIF